MARRVVWSPEALADLADIYHYIKLDNQGAAKNVADKLRNMAKSIPDNPEIRQKCPEHNREDLRQRLYKKYRMIYQLVGDEVRILQIFHTRREKLPDLRIE